MNPDPPLLITITVISTVIAIAASLAYWHSRRGSLAVKEKLAQVSRELTGVQTRDPVTGLLTASWFNRKLEEVLLRCDAAGHSACVLYLDIDHFRSTNDAYGRTAGDLVLKEVAKRLASGPKVQAPATRLVSNEFAMLVELPLKDAKALAAELRTILGAPIKIPTGEVRLTCSMGIASYPEQGSRRSIIEKAAAAMRTVKVQGGDGFAEFDQAAADGRRESARMLLDLRGAVERQEFELFYQPKVDATTLQITAVEALIRWRHPQLGMISPDRFIPVAERYGVIQAIGRWVIEEACRQAKLWRDQGLRMRIAVNISGRQMHQDDFVEHLESVLQRTQTPPSRFTCEITESVAMEDTSATQRTFSGLGRLGVHVSIDDFGTGHSSLASLKKLPAEELKIDRAFVSDLGISEHAQFIATTIVEMAHSLKLKVVAEGVETQEQRDILVSMGCDELQGYLFAKPMRAEELATWAALDSDDSQQPFRPSLFNETIPARLE